MKQTVVYFFSGTGNSLVIAEKIKKRLEDVKLIEMSSALKNENFKTKAKTVGFVFPCHDYILPLPVKRFIKKLEVPKAEYIFAAVVRSDTDVDNAFNSIDKKLKKQNKALNATFVMDMPSNDPRSKDYVAPEYKDIEKIEKKINKMVSNIECAVKNKEDIKADAKLPDGANKKQIGVLESSVSKMASGKKKFFYVTDDCIGCKVCKKVCMSGKIEMEKGKPNWKNSKDCYACFACINYCPVGAIQIHSNKSMESHTEVNGRYHHPHVTYKDLIYRRKKKKEKK